MTLDAVLIRPPSHLEDGRLYPDPSARYNRATVLRRPAWGARRR